MNKEEKYLNALAELLKAQNDLQVSVRPNPFDLGQAKHMGLDKSQIISNEELGQITKGIQSAANDQDLFRKLFQMGNEIISKAKHLIMMK